MIGCCCQYPIITCYVAGVAHVGHLDLIPYESFPWPLVRAHEPKDTPLPGISWLVRGAGSALALLKAGATEHPTWARGNPAVIRESLSGDARIVSGGLLGVLRVVGHLVQICIIPGQNVCLSALAYQGNHVVVVVAGASVSLFQVIASPDGSVPWVSGVLPGSVRDKKTVSNVAW